MPYSLFKDRNYSVMNWVGWVEPGGGVPTGALASNLTIVVEKVEEAPKKE